MINQLEDQLFYLTLELERLRLYWEYPEVKEKYDELDIERARVLRELRIKE